ncbi:MAG TPA: alpha/beta fold hydrolase [Dongiaceae bacterium]|nr:alpha/beta fold hydrolase [Dongiaceae bacterium]
MPKETVVLLHGLGRSPLAMAGLHWYLHKQGYRVVNQGYASRRHPIPELCRQLFHDLIPHLAGGEGSIHFVTHSLGGILLRYGLQHWQAPIHRLGRAVMLAPPSQGSELVDQLRRWPLLPRVLGPAFLQLGTDPASIPQQLLLSETEPFPLEVGIIAGRRSIDPLLSRWLEGEHDGKVTVARSRLPGMADFRVMDANHTFIMNDRAVRAQVVHFLRHGRFQEI